MIDAIKGFFGRKPFRGDPLVTHAYDNDIGIDDEVFAWFDLYSTSEYAPDDKKFPMARAYALCQTNALAKRLLNFVSDIVVSTGITVTSEDKALNQVFKDFQENHENSYHKMCQNLSKFKMIFGETAFEPIKNPLNGMVTLNPLFPTHIRRVRRDPKNNNFDKSFEFFLSPTKSKKYNVMRPYLKEQVANLPENSAFFWKHNILLNESRGIPDLLPVFDIIKAHKDIHIELKEQVKRYNWILLLVEMATWEDYSTEEQKQKMQNIADTVRKGGVIGYGKGDKYEWITPNFQDFDIKTIELAYLKYVLLDFGFPLHFFATPDNSNRATAQEMDYPTEVSMLSHQTDILEIIRQIFTFVKWSYLTSDKAMGKSDNPAMNILIEAPSVSSRLALRQAEGFQRFVETIDQNFREFPLEFRAELKAQASKAAGFYFDKGKTLAAVEEPPPEPMPAPGNAEPLPGKKSKRFSERKVA